MIDIMYTLPPDIYPNGVPDNSINVPVSEIGIDTNLDGISDNWEFLGAAAFASIGTIVTGNGFVGNAQRCVENNTNNRVLFSTSVDGGLSVLQGAVSYTITFDYRSSITLNIVNEIYSNSFGSVAANTGNAISASIDVDDIAAHTLLARICFKVDGVDAWFEINNVKLIEKPLIAHYPLTGGSLDESGNNEDGTIYGATEGINRFGNLAMNFVAASSQYITSPVNASISAISFWMKADANNSDIIQLSATAKISINASNEITTTGLTASIIRVNDQLGIDINSGQWNYIDISFTAHTADAVIFGYSASYFDGLLGDVRLMNRAFTDEENKAIHKMIPSTDLILYYGGYEGDSVTGGWIQGYVSGNGVYTKNSENIELDATASGVATAQTTNRIQLDDYNTVTIKYQCVGTVTAGQSLLIGAYNVSGTVTKTYSQTFSRNLTTVTIDISTWTGTYYIGIEHVVGSGGLPLTTFIYSIKLIK